MTRPVRINASQPQHVPAGRLLGTMYYGGFLQKVLSRDQYSGYPHNGGEHTLDLTMTPPDIDAFLDLVEESFAGHEGVPAFVGHVRAKCPAMLTA